MRLNLISGAYLRAPFLSVALIDLFHNLCNFRHNKDKNYTVFKGSQDKLRSILCFDAAPEILSFSQSTGIAALNRGYRFKIKPWLICYFENVLFRLKACLLSTNAGIFIQTLRECYCLLRNPPRWYSFLPKSNQHASI